MNHSTNDAYESSNLHGPSNTSFSAMNSSFSDNDSNNSSSNSVIVISDESDTQKINIIASMIRTLIIDASRIRVPFRDFWHHYVRVPCLIADATSIAPMACVS